MSDGTTHYAGCSESGPKHYECALAEIGRLRLTITHLREEVEKHYELGTEYFDLYTKAEREIAGLRKLLKIDAIITATEENK